MKWVIYNQVHSTGFLGFQFPSFQKLGNQWKPVENQKLFCPFTDAGRTRWPLYFLTAQAACQPLSPFMYTSIYLHEWLENLMQSVRMRNMTNKIKYTHFRGMLSMKQWKNWEELSVLHILMHLDTILGSTSQGDIFRPIFLSHNVQWSVKRMDHGSFSSTFLRIYCSLNIVVYSFMLCSCVTLPFVWINLSESWGLEDVFVLMAIFQLTA